MDGFPPLHVRRITRFVSKRPTMHSKCKRLPSVSEGSLALCPSVLKRYFTTWAVIRQPLPVGAVYDRPSSGSDVDRLTDSLCKAHATDESRSSGSARARPPMRANKGSSPAVAGRRLPPAFAGPDSVALLPFSPVVVCGGVVVCDGSALGLVSLPFMRLLSVFVSSPATTVPRSRFLRPAGPPAKQN